MSAPAPPPPPAQGQPPTWTSPLISPYLARTIRGQGPLGQGAAEKALRAAFPSLTIAFSQLDSGKSKGHYVLQVTPNLSQGATPADLTRCRRVVLNLIFNPRQAIQPQLTHSLPAAAMDQFVQWRRVPDHLARLAAELDSPPPLYVLGAVDPYGMTADDIGMLLDSMTFRIGNERVKRMGHNQSFDPPLDDDAAMADRVMQRFGGLYRDLCTLYPSRSERTFKMTATLGFHVYSHINIRDPLALALPRHAHEAVGCTLFTMDDVITGLKDRKIKSSFCEALPVKALLPALAAIKTGQVGLSKVRSLSEKVAVRFVLAPSIIDEFRPKMDLPKVAGYDKPQYEFKLTLLYDETQAKFVVCDRGLRFRWHRMGRHTWVELVDPPSAVDRGLRTVRIPVMARMYFAAARQKDRPPYWPLAALLVKEIEHYVNANVDVLRRACAAQVPDPEAERDYSENGYDSGDEDGVSVDTDGMADNTTTTTSTADDSEEDDEKTVINTDTEDDDDDDDGLETSDADSTASDDENTHRLSPLPDIFRTHLSHFHLRHKRVISLMRPGTSTSPLPPTTPNLPPLPASYISISLKLVTMYYRFNTRHGDSKWPLTMVPQGVGPKAQPTFLGIELRDHGFGTEEWRAPNPDAAKKEVEARAGRFADVVGLVQEEVGKAVGKILMRG
ncbi:hypothetical protein BCR44DRAFT_34089 [Catenaria anguillulae PL171]|uniref:Uncharacterized protein n=1 Tax=Catenaria anguillulae PL171 TaxID=765915 RepID=A0A1Y2HX32_9FUNG|nr:hypothetical protein BCR44DRAFT_34089 [Catenaria anguillulae PL171]